MRSLKRLPAHLGLAESVRTTNVVAYCASCCFTICSVVFLSGASTFVITSLLHQRSDRVGRINGNLILTDELVALPSVVLWGAISNRYGVRPVSATGHVFVAIGMVLFVHCRSVGQLYLARGVISIGVSALTTMLTAVISSMTALRTPSQPSPSDLVSTESEPLLQRSATNKTSATEQGRRSARLAGALGTFSGIGALIGAFGLLRLPATLADKLTSKSPDDALRLGIVYSFYTAAAIAFCVGVTLLFALRRKGEATWSFVGARDRSPGFKFFVGLKLGFTDRDLGLAFISSFAARAIAVTSVTYIPLYVASWFIRSGRCHLERPDLPKEELKTGCYQAFQTASALTGVVQATALCAAPLVGFLASRYSQRLLLSISLICGVVGFFTLGSMPTPTHPSRWPATVAIGLSQSGSTVVGLAICARARSRIVSTAITLDGEDARTAEVAGAIAGATSLWGGAGVLLTGSVAGWAADVDAKLPFIICGTVAILPLVAVLVQLLLRRLRRRAVEG